MTRLSLSCATWNYDRTAALIDGRVQPEGLTLNYVTGINVEEIFWLMLKHGAYDVSEMSMSSYILTRDRGDPDLMAIPVYLSRFFRHGSIFINTRAGIRSPGDLRGRRIGLPEWQMTACVYLKGILQDEYGIGLDQVTWVIGGQEDAGRSEKLPVQYPPGVRVENAPVTRTLNEMLVAGEIDALVTARMPSAMQQGNPAVARLFPDYRSEEARFYAKTGVFPIMHTVVMRGDVYRNNPWVAPALYKAFCRAKDLAGSWLYQSSVLSAMVPWLVPAIEDVRTVMGNDYWPYGLEGGRKALAALCRYEFEQGITRRQWQPEELFAPETLVAYKI